MAQTAQLRRVEVIENEAQRVFALQREAYLRHPYPSLEERRENLSKLERILVDNADAIADAINRDFGHRSAEESKMLELFACVDGIRHTRRKLRKWMKPQRRHVSVLFATGSNRVIPQPKGVVGIVSPWNYPALPHRQPADQRPRRRQPRHDQDGDALAEPLPPARREVRASSFPRTRSPSCPASARRTSRPCPSTTSSSPARPTPAAP